MTQFKYNKIEVKLLNKPDIYEGFKLWMKSRESIIEYSGNDVIVGGVKENLKNYEKKILYMNLQYNNFPTFHFEVTGSLLSRDIFFNISEFSQWSTSTRFFHSLDKQINDDMLVQSEEYADREDYNQQFLKFKSLLETEENPDKARLEMPYSMCTRYWVGINLKQLTSFIGMTKIKLPNFYENYGIKIIEELKSHDIDISELIPNFVDSIYYKYFNPVKEFKVEKFEVNDYIHMSTHMGMILYSQFLRQSSATTSGLYDFLSTNEDVIKGSTQIPIYHTSHKDRFMRTITNRTCAFSMSDEKSPNSWYHILEPYLQGMGLEEFKEILPCKYEGNQLSFCKFREDIKFRNNKFEKNLPCPMLACNLDVANQRLEKSDTTLNKLYKKLTETLEPSDVTLPYEKD